MLAVALGSMLVPLNSTMIAVALPDLVEDFDSDLASVTWLVTAYLIAMVVLQPVAGRLGDRLGRGPVVVAGLAGFVAASAGAALAPGLALLILFRVLQAASGALVIPNGLALVRERTEEGRLGGRMGLIGTALTPAAAAGPPLGGALVAAFGWRAIFVVNLPLAGLALALGARFIPWRRSQAAAPSPPARLRGLPAGLLAAATGIALTNLAMYVTLLSIPLLLDRRAGVGSGEIGLVLGCLSITMAALSPLGGRLSDRVGRRLPAAAGAAVLAASLLVLGLDPGLGSGAVAALLLGAGAGVGLATPALQTAAIQSVRIAHSGTAAGLTSTSRYVGSITGTLLLAGPLAPAAAGEAGFGLLYATLAGCSAAAVAAAVLLPRRGGAREEESAAAAPADGLPAPPVR
jgi:MFS family permease